MFYEPDLGFYRLSVGVSLRPGDYEELLESWFISDFSRSSDSRIEEFESFESWLNFFYVNLYPLWVKPYIIVKLRPDIMVIKDRGVRFRSFVNKVRVKEAVKLIPKRKLKIRGGYTNAFFMTITVPRNVKWCDSFDYVYKRFREIYQYLHKRYGIVYYVGVYELHDDGYPHIHVLFVTKKRLKTFRHKNTFRLVVKREWDRDLEVDKHGFIDVFSPSSKRVVVNYLSKYLNKFFVFRPKSENNSEETEETSKTKGLILFVSRYFRFRPVIMSRSLSKKLRVRPETRKITLTENEVKIASLYHKIKIVETTPDMSLKKYAEISKLKRELYDLMIKSWNCSNRIALLLNLDVVYREWCRQSYVNFVFGSRVSFN